MTLREKQDALVAEINAMGDCFEQYSYLIMKSGQLPPMAEADRIEENRFKGCQAEVWLKIEIRQGRLFFSAHSDTLIIRGVLAILWELVSSAPVEQLAQTPLDFLARTELAATFTSTRTSGMGRIMQEITGAAAQAAGRESPPSAGN